MSKAPTRRRRVGLFLLLLLLALCAALLLLSKYGLSVTRLSFASARLPESFDGFRIVQLSDLHGARFGRDNARLLEAVAAETPDLIVLTGDFLDEGRAEVELPALDSLVQALVRLAPVYYVSGNHDWASGEIETLAQTLEAAGARYLRNEYLRLERGGESILLCGVEDPNGRADMETPDQLAARARAEAPEGFILLLGHRNYWIERYPTLPVDLILCGHSHGGIVRLPFLGGLVGTRMEFFPAHEAGLFETAQYGMFVSRGLGNSVPLPRFLNTPELVSITLRKK